MKIKKRQFRHWDKDTRRKLMRASFRYGFMRKYAEVTPESYTLVAFSNKQIMGWALNFTFNGLNMFNIFVNARFRNRGVAVKLIEAGIKSFGKIVLGAHDDVSTHLFYKMKDEYPKNITVVDWSKYREKMAKAVIMRRCQQNSFYQIMLLL